MHFLETKNVDISIFLKKEGKDIFSQISINSKSKHIYKDLKTSW